MRHTEKAEALVAAFRKQNKTLSFAESCTGGLAAAVVGYCKHDISVDEELVLKGLNILYHKNK